MESFLVFAWKFAQTGMFDKATRDGILPKNFFETLKKWKLFALLVEEETNNSTTESLETVTHQSQSSLVYFS